jgi:hypothetical protein
LDRPCSLPVADLWRATSILKPAIETLQFDFVFDAYECDETFVVFNPSGISAAHSSFRMSANP